jgi:hypothetical protein
MHCTRRVGLITYLITIRGTDSWIDSLPRLPGILMHGYGRLFTNYLIKVIIIITSFEYCHVNDKYFLVAAIYTQ